MTLFLARNKHNTPVCCVDPTGSLGSFFDFPFSMTDRMQMSQSMLDNYYAAKRAQEHRERVRNASTFNKVLSGLLEDAGNYNRNNESEIKALESNYFSSYKGIPVI